MQVKDINEVREFVLLDGTEDKVEFKWPVGGHPIGAWTAKVDAVLLGLRERFAADPRLAPNCAMVDGIRLAWCFTALEVERLTAKIELLSNVLSNDAGGLIADLRAENAELKLAIEVINKKLAGMESTLAQSVAKVGGR
jgi:hypothetical protein